MHKEKQDVGMGLDGFLPLGDIPTSPSFQRNHFSTCIPNDYAMPKATSILGAGYIRNNYSPYLKFLDVWEGIWFRMADTMQEQAPSAKCSLIKKLVNISTTMAGFSVSDPFSVSEPLAVSKDTTQC